MPTTLKVRVEPSADNSDLAETFAALDAGEDVEPRDPVLSLESLTTFGRVFRPTNLELLEAIVDHEPGSIRELARVVDRHPPEVLENVDELADYGLLELEAEGSAKRPVVWYDEIDVDIPIGNRSPDPTHA